MEGVQGLVREGGGGENVFDHAMAHVACHSKASLRK